VSEPPGATPPSQADLLTDTAAEQGLDPRARTLWRLYGAVLGAISGVALSIGIAFVDNPWPLAVLLVPALAAAAARYARLHWERWHWATSAEGLAVRHGVVLHHASYVPYHRIQQIDVDRNPADRAFGLARLVVHTAAATTDARIPGLDEDGARSLRQQLLEQASIDDGV
jgi:uncharacterized protein